MEVRRQLSFTPTFGTNALVGINPRQTRACKPTNLLPQELIDLLGLEHVDTDLIRWLTPLCFQESIPTEQEWVAQGIPMGFPDNPVWSSVAQSLEGVTERVQEAMNTHSTIRDRIKALTEELNELQSQQAQWEAVETVMKYLHENGDVLVQTAKQMSQAEAQISEQTLLELQSHLAADEDQPTSDELSAQIILRCTSIPHNIATHGRYGHRFIWQPDSHQ